VELLNELSALNVTSISSSSISILWSFLNFGGKIEVEDEEV